MQLVGAILKLSNSCLIQSTLSYNPLDQGISQLLRQRLKFRRCSMNLLDFARYIKIIRENGCLPERTTLEQQQTERR